MIVQIYQGEPMKFIELLKDTWKVLTHKDYKVLSEKDRKKLQEESIRNIQLRLLMRDHYE